MRRRLVPLLLPGMIALGLPALPAASAPALTSVIVVLEAGPGSVREVADELARVHGGRVGYVYTEAIEGFSMQLPAAAVPALARSPRVDYVEPDVVVRTTEQVMPTGIDRVEGDLNPGRTFYGAGSGFAGVDIAVIDTGVYIGTTPDGGARSHLDLNLVAVTDCTGAIFYDMFPFLGGCSGSGNFQDENGHGTHVAGIAAARDNAIGSVGSAPGATLWSVKVLNGDGSGTLGSVLAGVDFVTAHASEIEVANMSLGVEGIYQSLNTGISNSVAAGVVYVVAAGNSGKDASGFTPANNPDVITVSALADFDGRPGGEGSPTCRSDVTDDHLAVWSNYGEPVDIASPGVCIYSTWLDDGYNTISGTSMAAPLVAGAAARHIAENGRATNRAGVLDIRDALVAGGVPQSHECGFTGDPDSLPEPLLFLNGSAFGGDGACGAGEAPNTAPTVTISSPPDPTTVAEGSLLTFAASADDPEDGDLSAGISWESSLDGHLGTGSSITATLTEGTHLVTASVTDTGGATGGDSVTVTVVAPAEPSSVHVADLDGAATTSRSSWTPTIRILVHDSTHAPASGVVVNGAWTGSGSVSCTTGSDGTCTVVGATLHKKVASTTFTVSGLTASGLSYAEGSNHDPDGDSDGTTITVTKP